MPPSVSRIGHTFGTIDRSPVQNDRKMKHIIAPISAKANRKLSISLATM